MPLSTWRGSSRSSVSTAASSAPATSSSPAIPATAPRSAASARAHVELGERARLVEGPALADEVGSPRFAAGLVVERSGAVHPAALVQGLEEAARSAGARIAPGAEVVSVGAAPGGGRLVHTRSGDVRAGEVLVTTGAETRRVLPFVSRRLLPVGSFIIATEPLRPGLAGELIPRGRMLFDTRNFLNYWRLSPDGERLLFGGRTSFAPTTVEQARDRLYAAMVHVHPQLRGVRVERAWGGLVDLTVDREPRAGRDQATGAWYAAGFSGTGVALSVHLGSLMARWVCGEDPSPAFGDVDRRWRRVPWPAR